LCDVVRYQCKVPVRQKWGDIRMRSRQERIHAEDVTPRTQQSLTQVGTQKASTTSNKNAFGDHGNLAGTKAECNEQVNCIIISAYRCWISMMMDTDAQATDNNIFAALR